MRPEVFDIFLTKTDAVYFPGQTIQGQVNLELGKAVKVQGIRITFKGKAFVHWTDQLMRGPGETRFKQVRHHSATEDYFDVSQALLTKDPECHHNGDGHTLDAGQFTYPFQFIIPKTCPSSFEGQYGYIRYFLKVSIERHWKGNVSIKKIFTVISPVDLNRDASCSQTIQAQKSKHLCCACCVSGPISAYLRLGQKGYVSGETMSIFAEINNQTRRKIRQTSIELLMTTTFKANTKSRSITQQVTRLCHGSVGPGQSDTWEDEQLVIPPLPPSYLIGCGIINIRYTLELRVFPGGPAFALSVPLDILIGTVPLHSTAHKYWTSQTAMGQPPPSYSALNGACADTSSQQNRRPSYIYPIFSPSTMCEIHIRDDDEEHGNTVLNKDFSPSYTNYNFRAVPNTTQIHQHHHQQHHRHHQERQQPGMRLAT